ncbi:type I glutamate--ammonia ligase [bacterium]|nr:type I glutamate--ammonia ligase [bacterium]
MFDTPENLLKFAQDHKVEMIDLKFADLTGRWHHVTMPDAAFTEKVIIEGVGFDSSSLPGFKSETAGDMVLLPDISTAVIDPFWESYTLSIICDIMEADSLVQFSRNPRGVLKKTEQYLKSMNIADSCQISPEYEFYIFDGLELYNDDYASGYDVISYEGDWNRVDDEAHDLGYKIPLQGGYHAIPPLDSMYNLRAEIVKYLESAGIKVKYHHHEVGAPGQTEIEVLFNEPLKACDQGMMIKYIIRMVCQRRGKTASFMPKPLYKQAGSGMHFHQFLQKDGKSLFYKEGGYANLSDIALHYIGGILKHTPAVMAFTNPSTNSYKRLVPGFEAPTRLFFGLANRSATIRIPKYDDNPIMKRIEFRPGDASCNIYFAAAAQLLAGIDGIKNKIDPAKEGFGPYDMKVQYLPPEEAAKIKSVPENMLGAMEALDKDRDFLKIDNIFNDDLIDTWIDLKTKEHYDVINRPHPHEFFMYHTI